MKYNIKNKMSMSTNIADLPGPKPEENDEEEYIQEYEYENNSNEYEQEDFEPRMENELPKEMFYEQPSAIKMNIKKAHKEKQEDESMFEMLKREVNEENLLILIILYVASTSLVDEYAKKVLTLVSFNTSSFAVNIVKCVLLLIAFIIAKNYILPYIKL